MTDNKAMVWDLDVFFPGGSASPKFAAMVEEIERLTAELLRELQADAGQPDAAKLVSWIGSLQAIQVRVRESDGFVACLTSQDMKDKRAVGWTERVQTLWARYRQALDLFDAKLSAIPDEEWSAVLREPGLTALSFVLNERREGTKEKLPPELEALAGELAVDGYHGWGEHYGTITGKISIPWEDDQGQTIYLSAGQAANKKEDADPAVRDKAMALWEQAWSEQADLCADTLNRLAGFRLKLYARRGWDDVLREPLRINRMSRATLDAMWAGVAESVTPLKRYLAVKAKLLGKEKLDWQDVDAPLPSEQSSIAYDDAAKLIGTAFGRFSPDLAALADRAFRERWIEAEDRPGKRPGGFCTDFPLESQTRIFMTYSGTPGNVSTLAHELGHAYHGDRVFDLAPLNQEYAMNVAETASTFAEGLVSDELLSRASSDAEKLALLESRLQSAVAFCMNIRARFLFETRFYQRRAKGMLDAAELSGLMVEAQREAFGDALGSWHPTFWASKLHFYITEVPFYNFPYTFGYLFSTGLLAVAEKEGAGFHRRYDALLRDTGMMTVEELARRHLGVRLDEPGFWRDAVARAVADVAAFEQLAMKRV